MQNTNPQIQNTEHIHWGHFSVIALALVLFLGMTWMEKPQFFNIKKPAVVASADVPQYYPYVAPADDQPQVLGASTDGSATSTDEGPEIINDDGSVQPVDIGQVLAASTQGVQLSLDAIKVNAVPDSTSTIQNYFTQSQQIESGVSDTDFAAALNSGDQSQINSQAQKVTTMVGALQKLDVPQSLVQLQKLQIIQYNSAIQMLQNFTNADQNPDQITTDMEQFLKSEQDLETEQTNVAQKFPQLDPIAAAYVDSNGNPLPTPASAATDLTDPDNSQTGVGDQSDSGDTSLDNSDNSDDGQ